MSTRRRDTIARAVRLLTASVAVAFDPTGVAVGVVSSEIHDLAKSVAASPPASVAGLASELAAVAEAHFAATSDLPPDAAVLYEQMVEAGVVAADRRRRDEPPVP